MRFGGVGAHGEDKWACINKHVWVDSQDEVITVNPPKPGEKPESLYIGGVRLCTQGESMTRGELERRSKLGTASLLEGIFKKFGPLPEELARSSGSSQAYVPIEEE